MNHTKIIAAGLLLTVFLGGCGTNNIIPQAGLSFNSTEDTDNVRIDVPDIGLTDDTDAYIETPTTTASDSTVTAKPGETRIRFLAAGDNIIHENVFLDAKSRAAEGEKYNFTDMYDGIAEFVASADLAFINQETVIGGDELGISGYPMFNSPEAVGDQLIDVGFNIINVASNHTLDKKEIGYRNTLDYWHERDDRALMIGGYYNKEDYENIRVINEQGISIAFLSYTYGTNGMYLPENSEMHIPYIDEAEIVRMTKKADKLADLVFVVMHWGDENRKVTDKQKSLAESITEAGADVILGMHPHIIQPVEWMTASDGSRTLVVYSLGNLLSTQYDNYNLVGGIITFDIVKTSFGEVSIDNPIYNPTVTHYNKDRLGLQVYLMEDYTEELVSLHGNPDYGQTASSRIWTMDKIKGFATDYIDDEFLPEFLK